MSYVPQRFLHARIAVFDRAWFLRDLRRLVEAVNYSERMKRAGVPTKNRLKILRRYKPLPWAMRQELSSIARDFGPAVRESLNGVISDVWSA